MQDSAVNKILKEIKSFESRVLNEIQGAKEELKTKTDNLQAQIIRFEMRVDQRFDEMEQRFNSIDKRLDRLDERLNNVDQRLNHFDVKMEKINKTLYVHGIKIDRFIENPSVSHQELEQFARTNNLTFALA